MEKWNRNMCPFLPLECPDRRDLNSPSCEGWPESPVVPKYLWLIHFLNQVPAKQLYRNRISHIRLIILLLIHTKQKSSFRIHLILTWIRIRILGSIFGKSGSGSSDPPFRNSGSRSSDPHLEKVDPDPVPKWIRIRIRVPIFHIFIKKFMSDKLQCLFCYRQNLEKAFLR